MSFTRKLLKAEITLANGQFQGGGNSLSLLGLRMKCDIEASPGNNSGTMEMSIYGIPLDVMNQLSLVGPQAYQAYQNTIKIYAGDAEGDEYSGFTLQNATLVYSGKIFTAMVEATSMPQVNFHIGGAAAGGDDAVTPNAPISLSGSQDAVKMLSGLASKMGLQFENAGVQSSILQNPYYGGSPWQQAWQIAQHANISLVVEKGIMIIAPPGGARSGDAVLISKDTGLQGYPSFNQAVLILATMFNPALKIQGKINILSDITPANGEWTIRKLTHQLDCLMPHGRWRQVIEANQESGQKTGA